MKRGSHITGNRLAPRRARILVLALLALAAGGLLVSAQEPGPAATSPDARAAAAQEPVSAGHQPATPAGHGEGAPAEGEHETGWSPLLGTLGRLLNFAILAGVLVYYLRAPIANYLSRRSTEIRSDLTKAAETRESASAELVAIEQKMKALPQEIETLKSRGAREVAAEEARIREAAAAERERLLEQTRREIELQVKAAERELTKRAADLSIALATERVKKTITDEDQARLVDRYLADVAK